MVIPEFLFVIALVQGYILGSINTSIIVGKLYGLDIRNHGSGNAGMTNTLRTMGKLPAIIVIIGDMLKAIVAGIVGMYILPEIWGYNNAGLLASGFGALMGHNWPIFFGFKGGKGILTGFTVILIMDYRLGLALFGIFFIIVLFTKYISLGSIVCAISFPALSLIFRQQLNTDMFFTIFAILVGGIIIIKHSSNIDRLIKGTENKFSLKKKMA